MGWIHGSNNEYDPRGDRKELSQSDWLDVVAKHQRYLAGEPGGERLILKYAVVPEDYIPEILEANFSKARFEEVIFDSSELGGWNFTNASFSKCRFNFTDLNRAIFTNAGFYDCTFTNGNLSKSTWLRSDMVCVKFTGTCLSLREAFFSGTKMKDVVFAYNVDLKGATFKKIKWEGDSIFPVGNLESTIFVDSEFRDTLVGLLSSQLKIKTEE